MSKPIIFKIAEPDDFCEDFRVVSEVGAILCQTSTRSSAKSVCKALNRDHLFGELVDHLSNLSAILKDNMSSHVYEHLQNLIKRCEAHK